MSSRLAMVPGLSSSKPAPTKEETPTQDTESATSASARSPVVDGDAPGGLGVATRVDAVEEIVEPRSKPECMPMEEMMKAEQEAPRVAPAAASAAAAASAPASQATQKTPCKGDKLFDIHPKVFEKEDILCLRGDGCYKPRGEPSVGGLLKHAEEFHEVTTVLSDKGFEAVCLSAGHGKGKWTSGSELRKHERAFAIKDNNGKVCGYTCLIEIREVIHE